MKNSNKTETCNQWKKKLLVLVVPFLIIGVAAICIYLPDQIKQRQAESELDELVLNITYKHSRVREELNALTKFDEKRLSIKGRAKYFSALLKRTILIEQSLSTQNIIQVAQNAFTQGIISSEESGEDEIAAWIYADAAQLFINASSYSTAMECLFYALKIAEHADMEPYFYAYCYTRLAFCSSCSSSPVKVIKQYQEKAASYEIEEESKYLSLEMQRTLIDAQNAYQYLDYEASYQYLIEVKKYIDTFPTNERNIILLTNFILPYYKTAVCLAIHTEQKEELLSVLEEGYNRIAEFMEVNFRIDFITTVLTALQNNSMAQMDSTIKNGVLLYIENALIKMPLQITEKNAETGKQMFSSAHSTYQLVMQKSKTEQLYKTILQILFWVALLFIVMIVMIAVIRKRSNIDGLTKAYIRRYYDEIYLKLCRNGKTFGLIMYDIDYFKKFNDNYGHEFGDKVLIQVSATTISLLNKRKAKLFRFGGDEFIIICRRMSFDEIVTLAENIRAAVEAIVWEVDTNVTLSIGASISSQAEDNLMKLTDENVYRSKEAGRNKVSYQPLKTPEFSFEHKKKKKR